MAIQWHSPWRLVDERWATYIAGELAWELAHFPDHPLTKRSFEVVAMLDPYDNAIIRFRDGTFAYVHLPWRAQSPHFEPIGGEAELVHFLQRGARTAPRKST